jgi:capsule polysaccharide modification protein KpsS
MLLIDAEELKALIEDSVQHAVKDVISEFNNQDDSDLLTINETSKMLRKSRTWLWRMEKEAKVRYSYHGRRLEDV